MKAINICGNVGKDAEVREAGEYKVLSFSVAVNSKTKGVEKTTWFDVSAFGDAVVKLQPYIHKGDKISVVGDLDTHEHNGKTYLKVKAFDRGITLIGKVEKRVSSGDAAGSDDSFPHGANAPEPSF